MNRSEGDYSRFGSRVQLKLGIRLQDYKPDQMIRRLRTLGEKHKCTSFADLAAKMDRDSGVLGEFLDHFTINVTELYRNPELFQHFIKIPCCPNSARTASVAPSKPGVRDIDEAQHRV